MSTILVENLKIALGVAIYNVEKAEKDNNCFTGSALLAGWKENLKALENNEILHIKYQTT